MICTPTKPDLGSSQKPAGTILHNQNHADALSRRSFLTTERSPVRSLTSERKLLMTQSPRKTKAAALQCLYRNLAEALVVVSQHPAIPARQARLFRELMSNIAPLAGVNIETLTAPRPGVENLNAKYALIQLGLAMANALENDEALIDTCNKILNTATEVEDLLKPKSPWLREAVRFRGIVLAYASVADPV